MAAIDPAIFKDYDIRGIFPEQINKEVAYKLGQVFVRFFNPKTVAIGRDMRLSSPEIFTGLSNGIRSMGGNVVDLGIIATDMAWFASGKYEFPLTVMITASHNPPEWNGLKLATSGAIPVSGESALYKIRDLLGQGLKTQEAQNDGNLTRQDILDDWISYALSFINVSEVKPLKIVIDAGNGMAGKIIPEVAKKLPTKIILLFFELDGSFPNHVPNPLKPENIQVLKEAVVKESASIGVAFDGDADRLVLLDEQGQVLSGTVLTAMIAKTLLEKNPGSTILYNAIVGRVVPEIVKQYGGKSLRVRVGYSLIKKAMRENNAIFCGEHSYHFFFKDNYFSDSGLIAFLFLLSLISKDSRPLSEIAAEFNKYLQSGEINFEVDDRNSILDKVRQNFTDSESKDNLDGVSVWYKDWWFNVRPSNTEPVVRLNIEADNKALLEEKTQYLVSYLEGLGAKKK